MTRIYVRWTVKPVFISIFVVFFFFWPKMPFDSSRWPVVLYGLIKHIIQSDHNFHCKAINVCRVMILYKIIYDPLLETWSNNWWQLLHFIFNQQQYVHWHPVQWSFVTVCDSCTECVSCIKIILSRKENCDKIRNNKKKMKFIFFLLGI